MIEALELGGDYRLLHVFEKDGERRTLYRLLTSDGGLNYHEMVLEYRGQAGRQTSWTSMFTYRRAAFAILSPCFPGRGRPS